MSEGIRLRAEFETIQITNWLQDENTNQLDIDSLEIHKATLGAILEGLAILGSDIFSEAYFWLPSEVGQKAWCRNLKIMAQLLDGKHLKNLELGIVGVLYGLSKSIFLEREFVFNEVSKMLRRNWFFGIPNRLRVNKVNRRLRKLNLLEGKRLDYERGEHLRAAIMTLRSKGVSRKRINGLIDETLVLSDEVSGKSWKGLIDLRELVQYADVDPNDESFDEFLKLAISGGIHYTHTPGKEWVVRDFLIARSLLKADGKVNRETQGVAISQAGASIVPGIIANNPSLLELASRYMKPIQVYLNGMVAQSGENHRRHRGEFVDFFKKGEVLKRGDFIESTVSSLLDDVELIAKGNGGVFDFKKDLAFRFPIRIICGFMGIPESDVSDVQEWAEDSVRALDAGAGLSLSELTKGNKSAGLFLDYLQDKIEYSRNGNYVDGIIGEVSSTENLDDVELVSNLAGITFAGFETTTGLISMGFYELLKHPEQVQFLIDSLAPEVSNSLSKTDLDLRWYIWANDERKGRLKYESEQRRLAEIQFALDNESCLVDRLNLLRKQEMVLGNAVEEMLRWTAPGSVIPLTLGEDFELESPVKTEVKGCPVMKGDSIKFNNRQTIVVDITASNRQGCPFGAGKFEEDFGGFDVSRVDNNNHLSFGVAHICIGADLAVENSKRMIEGVLRRMPDLKLHGKPDELDGNLFVGLKTLPVKIPV